MEMIHKTFKKFNGKNGQQQSSQTAVIQFVVKRMKMKLNPKDGI
jgi:hypothetical protein